MAVAMKLLIQKYPGDDLELLAGSAGLYTPVSWVHVSELPRPGSFLKGGELVIMTCVCIDKRDPEGWLLGQIQSIRYAKASGVILNVGTYLPEIPQSCIDYCEENGFPLFSLGWKTDLQAVTRPLCAYLIQENEKDHTISNAFKNAIFFHDRQDLYVVPLSDYHFETEARYAVCVIKVLDCASEPYQEAQDRVQEIRTRLHYQKRKASVFLSDQEMIVVFCTDSEKGLRSAAEDLLQFVSSGLSEGEQMAAGVGKLTRSIRCVYKSYRQAAAIQALREKHIDTGTSCFYEDMGIYRLLLGIEEEDIKKDYVARVLGPLLEHDRKKGTNLVEVVRLYLKNEGSIQDTASQLFIHKNTVTYKINQASEILGIDLSTFSGKMQVQMALLVYDICPEPFPGTA